MRVFLDSRGHAYVNLCVLTIKGDISLDLLVDTGFSGGLSLPSSLKQKLDFPSISRATWELADGSEIELGVFLGKIRTRRGREEEIAVVFNESREGLVGIEFLRGKKFVLDLKKFQVKLG
jgi:clan AA aspartic protease